MTTRTWTLIALLAMLLGGCGATPQTSGENIPAMPETVPVYTPDTTTSACRFCR